MRAVLLFCLNYFAFAAEAEAEAGVAAEAEAEAGVENHQGFMDRQAGKRHHSLTRKYDSVPGLPALPEKSHGSASQAQSGRSYVVASSRHDGREVPGLAQSSVRDTDTTTTTEYDPFRLNRDAYAGSGTGVNTGASEQRGQMTVIEDWENFNADDYKFGVAGILPSKWGMPSNKYDECGMNGDYCYCYCWTKPGGCDYYSCYCYCKMYPNALWCQQYYFSVCELTLGPLSESPVSATGVNPGTPKAKGEMMSGQELYFMQNGGGGMEESAAWPQYTAALLSALLVLFQ